MAGPDPPVTGWLHPGTSHDKDRLVNLAEHVARTAARLPDKDAVVFRDERIGYAELADRIARGAGALQALGLRGADGSEPGDRIALMLGNSPQFVEAFHAALHAGLVVVPLNAGFTAEEVCHILVDSEAKAIVVGEPFLPVVEAARAELPALEHVIVAGAAKAPEGSAGLWRELRVAAEPAELAEVGEGALAVLQYTSGTTGRPKGALLSHGNLLANHEQMRQTQLRIEEQDIVLCVLPLFHIYALNVVMAFTLSRGASLLLVERFDAVQTLRDIETHRVSVIIGAPPMYVAWINTPGVEDLDLGSVRFAVSGAAALPAQVLERFREQFGIAIWEGYGLTETAPLLTTVAMGSEPRPGSIGRPVPGVELRLVDESGQPVHRGDPGEIVVRGPNVFSGYWRQPEATAEVLEEDGWFHTGDIAYADDGGYLYIVDRKKDLIIVSGFNVYPREVEEVLYRHPKITQAAVIGTPHPYTGEAVKAVVVLADGEEASADEIIDFCREHLARFKSPEVVEFAAELPLLPSGKVLRRELREQSPS